ncbi:MAG: HTH domain-containing protein [Candidatus Vogelbacteria bacterium]|nr:HTH domain-containing protein [Candidatus Vogelbacteria bacterium]
MIASHSQNKTLNRLAKILEFVETQYRSHADKETFFLGASEIFRFDPLLSDMDLLKMGFEKITDDTGGNVKIEFRQGLPERNTADPTHVSYELYVWFYVEDQNKFRDYQSSVRSRIERETKAVQFILDSQGFFYPEGTGPENRHSLKRNSNRYQLLYLLAKENRYIATKELAEKLNVSAPIVRKRIGEIRNIIAKKWELSREALFESDNASGYRVTNVTLQES